MHQQDTKTAELEKSQAAEEVSKEVEEVEEVKEVEATSSTTATEQKDETPNVEEPSEDAEQYPSRNPLVGGWAGGEIGLKQFVQVR